MRVGALLSLILLGGACGNVGTGARSAATTTAPASPGTGAGSAGSASAPDPLASEIEAMVHVQPPQRVEAQMLASELAADWRREAGDDRDSADVVALLLRELSTKFATARGRAPAVGGDVELEVVRAEVYDRRGRALSRRSFTLGKAVIDGTIADADAHASGEQILREVAALQAQVRALRDLDRVRVLSNALQEVSLEATFAIARGVTSRRLSDYQSLKSGAPDVR